METSELPNAEPPVGIEPTTARLRIECSTTELRWRAMPWSGLEPLRLAAPPPQDGVSTNFTTRAITSCLTPADPHLAVLHWSFVAATCYRHGADGARTRDLSSDSRVL